MVKRSFQVVLCPDEGGTTMATVPGLPECITWGRTEAEALENAREAIGCCVEARRKLGQRLPRDPRRGARIVTVRVAA
jgi:antitoxin HicB